MTFRPRITPRSLTIASLVLAGLAAGLFYFSQTTETERNDPIREPAVSLDEKSPQAASPIRFTEVARQAGLEFLYYGNPSPEHYMTEQNGGGCALFDFDGDGRLDVFLANGSHFDRPSQTASHALFRSTGKLHYENITEHAGLTAFGFGMGCAAGDFDGDGFTDLFLAGYGQNRLWQNQGDGTFRELVLDPAPDKTLWSTSAAFADLDGDGLLDLYVANYVKYAPNDPPCFTQQTPPIRISCGPLGREGQPDLLYHNLGDGRFANVSRAAGIAGIKGKGLGVSIADFDGDDRLDIYVACDTTENLLFHNLGRMQFEEVALSQGAAVGSEGLARSGMGVACADYNADGRFDLFVTNFQNEPNDLFENLGPAGFRAANTEMGLDLASRPALGFGTLFADFDLDQHPDLFVTNGHVWNLTSLGHNYAFAMRPHLMRNIKGKHFQDVSRLAGDYFRKPWVGRSVAAGDLDNDGDADLVVTQLLQPTAVLRNDSTRVGKGLLLQLIGNRSARQPLGARVDILVKGKPLTLRCPAGDSYQSSQDSRLIVPVGSASVIDQITVHWPGGSVEHWQNVPVSSFLTLIESQPQALAL